MLARMILALALLGSIFLTACAPAPEAETKDESISNDQKRSQDIEE